MKYCFEPIVGYSLYIFRLLEILDCSVMVKWILVVCDIFSFFKRKKFQNLQLPKTEFPGFRPKTGLFLPPLHMSWRHWVPVHFYICVILLWCSFFLFDLHLDLVMCLFQRCMNMSSKFIVFLVSPKGGFSGSNYSFPA